MKQKLEQRLTQELTQSLNQSLSLGLHYLELNGQDLEKELLTDALSNPYLEVRYPKKNSLYYPSFKSQQSLEFQDDFHSHSLLTVSEDMISSAKEEILYMNLTSHQKWLAEIIISSISQDGSLSVSLNQIAQYSKSGIEEINKIYTKLQDIFPFLHIKGEDFLLNYFQKIFNGKEPALTIALTILALARSSARKDEVLTFNSEDELFELIEMNNHKLNKDMIKEYFHSLKEQFIIVMNMISSLSDVESKVVHVLKPDVIVEIDREKVEMNARVFDEFLPIVTLKEDIVKRKLGKEEKESLTKAKMVIFSLEKRKFSMALFVEKAFQKQWKYFFYGNKSKVPFTMKEASAMLGVHVSTISRLVKNKYYYLEGVVKPLKDIFERGLKTNKDDIAKVVVLESISKILSLQPDYGKVTDQTIKEILEKKGILLSRRAVNKYRHMLLTDSSEEQ